MSHIQIKLTSSQVAHVVAGARERLVGDVLMARLRVPLQDADVEKRVRSLLGSSQHSQSLLRALLMLMSIPEDNDGIAVTSLPKKLGMSPASTHRYLNTWRALGVVTQDGITRRYRRIAVPSAKRRLRSRP